MSISKELIAHIRAYYETNGVIPLHQPTFDHFEKHKVMQTIESSFVSSVGQYVDAFERQLADYCGARQAIATVNGSAALHAALYMAGVQPGDLVITQALTFVATCNVIHHLQASPLFIDVNRTSLGLCPEAMADYLTLHAFLDSDGHCRHRKTKQIIRAVVPMHTFGHPVQLNELAALCEQWNLVLVEDAAESLGSWYKGQHTGTFGCLAALSFNGNKIITTGGGGALLCNSGELGSRAKHLTTTAKVPHPYEYYHDEPGFNFRMPNLNAALGCAQLSKLDAFLAQKRALAARYEAFFHATDYEFVTEPNYARSNYWLNAVICPSSEEKEALLRSTNAEKVLTRPVWQLMNRLPMYQGSLSGPLTVSEWLSDRLVNLPSTPVL